MGDIHPAPPTSSSFSSSSRTNSNTQQHHHHLRAHLPSPQPTTSYWQLAPHRLASRRSTPQLPASADVVVVGSGITAAFFCLELLAQFRRQPKVSPPPPRRVVVLEARQMCSGATGRNGGHLIVDQLAARRRREWEGRGWEDVASVVRKLGLEEECEWREVQGVSAWWRWGREGWEGVKRWLDGEENADGKGPGLRIVEDEKELRDMDLKGDVVGALVGDWGKAATLCPYKLICAVWERLEREGDGGVNLQMETSVLGIERGADGENNVVKTNRGEITAKHVVVATNGYVSQLLERFTGLVVPTQGQMTALMPAQEGRLLKHDYGMNGLKGQTGLVEDYLVQRPWSVGGHLMHGGARQWVKDGGEGVSDDSYNVDDAVDWLRDLPQRIDVGTDQPQMDLVGAWTGVMGYSKDHCPWVGAVPDMEGLWVSAGYTGHGMPNAPGCGRHVARLVAAALGGKDWRQTQDDAVASGEILEEFVVSEARLAKAERL